MIVQCNDTHAILRVTRNKVSGFELRDDTPMLYTNRYNLLPVIAG